MKLGSLCALAAAATLTLATPARAVTGDLGTLVSGVVASGTMNHGPGEFMDLFKFIVPVDGTGFASVASVPGDAEPADGVLEFDIKFLAPSVGLGGIAILAADGTTVLASDTDPSDGLMLTGPVPAGTYHFGVMGEAIGSQGGIYVGAVQFLAASVPEPSTLAAMLLGLAGLGAARRLRRQG